MRRILLVSPALLRVAAGLALMASACGDDPLPEATPPPTPDAGADPCKASPPDEIPLAPIHTPRWAFEPWISKDISTSADTYEFVAGFEERDIPVGVVVLDSPWETHYNTFVPSPTRYPGFGELVADLRERDIRVVLWVTQMVNSTGFDFEPGGDSYSGPSPNFELAAECGYFVNNGELSGWWKGVGGGIDFFNPDAVTWWHRQQDPLFDLGVAGFKLDFGDSYLRTDPVITADGPVPHQAYSEAYYADFYHYGVSRRGPEEFVTMVRPWDESYDFEGRFFARREHAPVGWVGDNRRDFLGLSDALDHIFRSADAGYVVVGSDIGGYLDRDDKTLEPVPFDLPAFSRWVAIGALTPFMQLHGRANLAPWTVPGDPEPFVALYRYWATLHHELVPFFYSLAERAYAEGGPMLHPQGDAATWPGDYRFVVGDALLVAPILDASGKRDVALPPGERWLDWWLPEADAHPGGSTLAVSYADELARIPLFVREGAILPAVVSNELTGLGSAASAGHATWLVYPSTTPSTFESHDEDGGTTRLDVSRDAAAITIALSRAEKPTILRARVDLPAAVTAAGDALIEHTTRQSFDAAASGWFEDAPLRSAWIKIPASAAPVTLVVETP